MKSLVESLNEGLKHISDRMFIKALWKIGGELTKEDLEDILGKDNPLIYAGYEVDSIHTDRKTLYFCYIKDGRDLEGEGSIEDYDDETVQLLYDAIIEYEKIYR